MVTDMMVRSWKSSHISVHIHAIIAECDKDSVRLAVLCFTCHFFTIFRNLSEGVSVYIHQIFFFLGILILIIKAGMCDSTFFVIIILLFSALLFNQLMKLKVYLQVEETRLITTIAII